MDRWSCYLRTLRPWSNSHQDRGFAIQFSVNIVFFPSLVELRPDLITFLSWKHRCRRHCCLTETLAARKGIMTNLKLVFSDFRMNKYQRCCLKSYALKPRICIFNFFFFYVLIWKAETECKLLPTGSFPYHLRWLQARGWSWGLGAQSPSPTWMAGIQSLELSVTTAPQSLC